MNFPSTEIWSFFLYTTPDLGDERHGSLRNDNFIGEMFRYEVTFEFFCFVRANLTPIELLRKFSLFLSWIFLTFLLLILIKSSRTFHLSWKHIVAQFNLESALEECNIFPCDDSQLALSYQKAIIVALTCFMRRNHVAISYNTLKSL